MRSKRMSWIIVGLLLVAGGYAMWTFTSRSAYEAAEYTVSMRDGEIEVRDYPELVLATTPMKSSSQGKDGSFMRLFGYISGRNSDDRKLAMTVPVFIESNPNAAQGRMGFVVPAKDVARGVPAPSAGGVEISTRQQGRFAVIRFSGQITPDEVSARETQLRKWMEQKGLAAGATSEVAGYDPPWLPGPLRRNEVLIRVTER